ncbi:MAG TPA: hypothetical protein VMT52_12745 [Planctomycetota bacterium]|nr:hypothetical protein [Planctomycetota bacterium]
MAPEWSPPPNPNLLSLNARHDDALKVANLIRKEWDDPGLHAAIDRALEGELPKR